VLLRKACGAAKGSSVPNKNKVGKLPMSKIEEIAKLKMVDLNANDLGAACRIVVGTARSMGIEVE
jgi:large subunit ribosomal protein L11